MSHQASFEPSELQATGVGVSEVYSPKLALWILEVADAEMLDRTAEIVGHDEGDVRPDPWGPKLARRLHRGEIDESARLDVEGAELTARRLGEDDAPRVGHTGQPELRRRTRVRRRGRLICPRLRRVRRVPVAERVRQRGTAERDHRGQNRKFPRFPAKQLQGDLGP